MHNKLASSSNNSAMNSAQCTRNSTENIKPNKTPQRRSLRLPTRNKSSQTGHLCTTAQAGADPGIFVCRSNFPGLKVERGLD